MAAHTNARSSLAGCTATHGTIVAVDFAHWGGPIVRGCGVDDSSGYQLLHAAGFTTAGDAHDGASFICRLGDGAFRHGAQYPTASEDACIDTPPASAYWSYWIAYAGHDAWTYSPLGPMADVPKPGEVELWTFGGTTINGASGSGVPRFTPDQLRAQSVTAVPAGTAVVTASRTPLGHGSGSPLGLIAGACVVVALCLGAGWSVMRRRRFE